jgi:glycosyltransferase involved in cell wall biosynthesis
MLDGGSRAEGHQAMRIAVVNWTSRRVGGIETYLDTVIRGLAEGGHELALWHEVTGPLEREPIFLPEGSSTWCIEELGLDTAVQRLRDWQPDVVYAHGLLDASLEQLVPTVAPAVFFVHQYHGTCVGGSKTWKFPRVVPCERRLGWQCLLHYYPHRCGGWNPLTMVREYQQQIRRLDALSGYKAIVTHTEHMRLEYVKHGFLEGRVRKIPFPVVDSETPSQTTKTNDRAERPLSNLLFIGRMDQLKGGDVLFEAAGLAANQLGRPLQLTFAGDGPKRLEWENKAKQSQAVVRELTVHFAGWVSVEERNRLYAESDLLVVPSLWPEPFGMVGIEAARFGVPSAAFAVGGIPEWLHDGENGHLAPGDPPTVQGLAQSIVKCLEDSGHHRRLCAGALDASKAYTASEHLKALLEIFSDTVAAESDR